MINNYMMLVCFTSLHAASRTWNQYRIHV